MDLNPSTETLAELVAREMWDAVTADQEDGTPLDVLHSRTKLRAEMILRLLGIAYPDRTLREHQAELVANISRDAPKYGSGTLPCGCAVLYLYTRTPEEYRRMDCSIKEVYYAVSCKHGISRLVVPVALGG